MARIIRKQGALVSIKLREDLYTIGEMLNSPSMQFYDICSSDGVWENIDLNQVKILFRCDVARVVNHIIEGKIKSKTVIPRLKEHETRWIVPYTSMDFGHYKGGKGDFIWLGGRVVDLSPETGPADGDYTKAPVLKEDLSLPEDRELIENLELVNMWGPDDLGDRLRRYFDTGINRDDLKFEVFPGLWDDREALRPLTRRLPVPLR